MKPGTVAQFSQSLVEAMENALKMEWLAVKREPLPDAGQEDRRLLFAAIAQGLLDYLKDHEADFHVLLTGISPQPTVHIQIKAPSLTLSPTAGNILTVVTATGASFSPGPVTVAWDGPATDFPTTVAVNGTFLTTFTPPLGAAPGKHIVAARDQAGNVALAVFSL